MDNLVEDLKLKGDEISAKVIGSEEYYVEITLDDDEIEDMYCSCPHFDDGNNCKHLAAVLYAVTESSEMECRTHQEKNEASDAGELLDTVDQKDLYQFLREELAINENLRFKFLARFQKLNYRKDSTEYLKYIDSVFDRHLGYDNFIHYNEVINFSLDVDDITEAIEKLIVNEEYCIALELIKHTVIRLGNLDIDDSLGTTSDIMDNLTDMLCEIIENSSKDIYDQAFAWVSSMLNGKILDYLEDYLIMVFMKYFNEDEKIKRKLEIIDQFVSEIKDASSWTGEWNLINWIKNKITLIGEILGDENEVERLLGEYIKYHEIRNISIERYIKSSGNMSR